MIADHFSSFGKIMAAPSNIEWIEKILTDRSVYKTIVKEKTDRIWGC